MGSRGVSTPTAQLPVTSLIHQGDRTYDEARFYGRVTNNVALLTEHDVPADFAFDGEIPDIVGRLNSGLR